MRVRARDQCVRAPRGVHGFVQSGGGLRIVLHVEGHMIAWPHGVA